MRTLKPIEKKHRYYATLTIAIALDILVVQEGIRLFRLFSLGETIFLWEMGLFACLCLGALGDNLLARKWIPKDL
jgi:hypothetical protein